MTSPAAPSPFARPSPISMAHTPSALRPGPAGTPGSGSPALLSRPSGLRQPLVGTATPTPGSNLRPPGVGPPGRAGSNTAPSIAPTSRSAAVQVSPADLEWGMEVLLRERLGRAEQMIEETCAAIDGAFDPKRDPGAAEKAYSDLLVYLQDTLTLVQRTGLGAIPLNSRPAADVNASPLSIQQLTQQITSSAAGVFAAHRSVRDGAGAAVDVLAKSAGAGDRRI